MAPQREQLEVGIASTYQSGYKLVDANVHTTKSLITMPALTLTIPLILIPIDTYRSVNLLIPQEFLLPNHQMIF